MDSYGILKNESVIINNQTKKLQCRKGMKVCRRIKNSEVIVQNELVEEELTSYIVSQETEVDSDGDGDDEGGKENEGVSGKVDRGEGQDSVEPAGGGAAYVENATQVEEIVPKESRTVGTQLNKDGQPERTTSRRNVDQKGFLRTSALVGAELRSLMYEGEEMNEENVVRKLGERLGGLVDKELLSVLVKVGIGVVEATRRSAN